MNDLTQTLLRSILKALAGAAVTKGLVDANTGEGIVGAVMLLVGVAWGISHHQSYKTQSNAQSGGKPPLLCLFLCAFLGVPALTMIEGCRTAPETVAYRTLGTTQITVDHAMMSWGDYVAKYHVPVAQEQQVQTAFNRYTLAAQMAITAAEDYAALTKSDSPDAPAAKTKAGQASALAAQNLSDLVGLLRTLGVSLDPAKP